MYFDILAISFINEFECSCQVKNKQKKDKNAKTR